MVLSLHKRTAGGGMPLRHRTASRSCCSTSLERSHLLLTQHLSSKSGARGCIRHPPRAAAADSAGHFLGRSVPLPVSLPGWLYSKHDKEIVALAFPALLAMLLDPLMHMINTALVGQLGTQQLSAVSIGGMAAAFPSFVFSFLMVLTTPKIAAAMVHNDLEKVSQMAATSFWIALVLGGCLTLTIFSFAPAIVAALNPAEPAVAQYATEFIQVRALGSIATLVTYVAAGTYRGLKDTRTPLYAAIGAAVTNLVLNVVFIFGCGWGVFGSGLATTIAHWVSVTTLVGLLVKSGRLNLQHMRRVPPLGEVWPIMRAGAVLSTRIFISMGMVMYASTLCVRSGATTQAAFEVVRQVWIVTIQFFECLNVASQSLCASYLGALNIETARDVLGRAMTLAIAVGAAAGLLVWSLRNNIISLFTSDPLVIQGILVTLPLVCALFAMDAGASVMDGGLLAASNTDALSLVQIAGTIVQVAILYYLSGNGLISAFSIWACLKLLTLVRFFGGVWLNYGSKQSPYNLAQVRAAT